MINDFVYTGYLLLLLLLQIVKQMDTLSLLAPLRDLRPGDLRSKIHGLRKFIPTARQSERQNGVYLLNKTFMIKRSQTCGSMSHAFIHNDEKRSESKRIVCAASQCSIQQNDKVSGFISQTKEFKSKFSYSFWSEADGPVKVSIMETEDKFAVYIQVLSLSCGLTDLELIWSIFRYDPSSIIAQGSKKFVAFTKNPFTAVTESSNSICMPFDQRYFDGHVVSLEFPSAQAPFFVSFKLHTSPDSFGSSSVFRTHKKTDFCIPVGISRGHPMPLGVSYSSDGSVNFSIFSKNAECVVLCLYTSISNESSLEIALDPFVNRTGDVWHVKMANCQNYVAYGYRCKGDILWENGCRFHMRYVLLDPYAKILGNLFPSQEQQRLASLTKCLGLLQKIPAFDWGNDVHPHIPMEKLVVYKLNVGLFTEDTSSQLSANLMGTFAGLEKKIHHFKNLGVNAILLDPIFSFDVTKGPYFPYNFFSPMNNYGPEKDGVSSITSMKNMVKSLHAEGIELLLEVVFSHTAEGGDAACQMITFRGIDNSVYYNVEGDIGRGANNSLNCNNPIVQGMILESLRYWVSEFRIDGFFFVNASALLVQGSSDHSFSRPPLIEAIAFDPLLSKTKIVADFWSPVDMSYKKMNFPHWKRFAEMNFQFCFNVRNFLRGGGLLCDIATRLCGSGDIFSNGRGPSFAFNFISKNLSLTDLVSYNDGSEQSWNCGEEGPTTNRGIIKLRQRQIRNFLFILFISLGVPVMNMGDESGLSTSCDDQRAFDWTRLNSSFGIENVLFIAFLSSLRSRRSDLLQVRNFLKVENIEWQGSDESFLDWNNPFTCKFLGMLLKANRADISSSCSDKGNMFAVFNASGFPLNATLPQLPWGSFWVRLVDTALPFPCFFANYDDPDAFSCGGLNSYQLRPHSCALFEAKKGGIGA